MQEELHLQLKERYLEDLYLTDKATTETKYSRMDQVKFVEDSL